MAQIREVRLVDDRDPSLLADETIPFGLDGKHYEIDLTADHAKALRESLEEWIEVARKASSSNAAPQRRRSSDTSGRADQSAIRAWARENGHSVNDRGRISEVVRKAYAEAH